MMPLALAAALLFADPIAQDLESIPSPYYLDQPCPGQTIGGLREAMGDGIPAPYQQDFDCSNMASYLQWKLRSQGFDAKICLSKHFRGDDLHAWVAVDIRGVRYYIDATDPALFALGPRNRNYQDYDSFEQIYSSIYDLVLEHPLVDFVWWGGPVDYVTEANTLEGRT